MEGVLPSEDKPKSISASPDFAQVYVFIQTFGALLKLPPITLGSLENFFVKEYEVKGNHLAVIHWRLLNTYRAGSRADWQRAAVKCARRHGLCADTVPYDELPALVRLKLFRLCCEEQFDYNVPFKSELRREEMESPLSRPLIGCDSTGQRHWLLKDSVFDIRLYGESHYDVEPPKCSQWVELARTLDELAEYISTLESTRVSSSASESHDTHMTPEKPSKDEKRPRSQSKKPPTKKPHPLWDGDKSIEGCIKCRRDINYSQMLLCDECDRECHTYCQYPRLWTVPRGKWICPICSEGHLIEELKRVYTDTSVAKANHERTLEKKEKSIARLQRTGLLLQNIILEEGEEAGKRPRRSRKEINYAELNDIPLPPLGRRDYVGSDWSPPRISKRRRFREEYIQEDYLAPRIRSTTRRFRGSPVADPQRIENSYTFESPTEDQVIDVDDDQAAVTDRCASTEDALSPGSNEPHYVHFTEGKSSTSDSPEEFQSNGHHSSSDAETNLDSVEFDSLMYDTKLSVSGSPITPSSQSPMMVPEPMQTAPSLMEPKNFIQTAPLSKVSFTDDTGFQS